MHDHDTLVELIEREYEVLARVAFLIVGDEGVAREIVQESFARLVARWSRVGGYDEPGAWLRTVTVRQALRARHRRWREPVVDAGHHAEPRSDGEATWAGRIDVAAAVQALPPGLREVVVLYYVLDLSTETIAAELGRSSGTVRAQLHQARARLAADLHQEVDDVAR